MTQEQRNTIMRSVQDGKVANMLGDKKRVEANFDEIAYTMKESKQSLLATVDRSA